MCTSNGFKKWFFARSMASNDPWQDRIYGAKKASLFAGLAGRVVEIGAGTGINLPYMPGGTSWIGIEPNPHMHRFVHQKAAHLGIDVRLEAGYAESLPFPDESVDAVVSTLVLCSVGDPKAALREALRVLKPGGKFLFIEHVAAPPGSKLRKFQRIVRPLWRCLGDGCRPDRDTRLAIEQAGFSETDIACYKPEVPFTMRLIRPHIAGVAIK